MGSTALLTLDGSLIIDPTGLVEGEQVHFADEGELHSFVKA